MNFLTVADRSSWTVDAQQESWKLPLLHVAQSLQHPASCRATDRALNDDARHAAFGLAAPQPPHDPLFNSPDLKKDPVCLIP